MKVCETVKNYDTILRKICLRKRHLILVISRVFQIVSMFSHSI